MVRNMEITTKSAKETQEFGQEFSNNLKGGEVIALRGDLGSGKTTFVQGLAHGLGLSDRIVSPTFILRRDYQTAKGTRLVHIDLYRLEDCVEKEAENLGLKDLFGKKDTIVVIEWADMVKDILPNSTIWITLVPFDSETRKIKIEQEL